MKHIIVKIVMALIIMASLAYSSNSSKNTYVVNKDDAIATHLIAKDAAYKLVFFGYAGCYHFCDPKLRQIDPIYEKTKKELDLKMLFIDISEETTLQASQDFAKAVNKEFEAIHPSPKDIKDLQKRFQDVYIKKMPDGEYLHSGFLYLLKKVDQTYYLVKIYPEFDKSELISADIIRRAVP